jgi:ankyrin repeat protein
MSDFFLYFLLSGGSALHIAAGYGRLEVCRLLLQFNAHVDSRGCE